MNTKEEKEKTGKKKYKLPPITFSKKISKEYNSKVIYIALGEPLLETFIQMCLDYDFGGKTTIKFDPKGRRGILCVYKGSIFSSSGNKICERLYCLFYNEEKDVFEPLSAESIWDFEDVINPKRIKEIPVIENINSLIEKAEVESISYFDSMTSDIRNKYIKEIDIRKKDLISYQQKIKIEINSRIDVYNNRLELAFSKDEKDNLKRLIGRERSQLNRILEQINNKLSNLEKEEVFIYDVPELIALADILPSRSSIGRRKQIDEIEQAGMIASIEYERKNNRKPIDVSREFRGYDIKSFNEEEVRYIEVKSFKTTGTLRITSHEWITSKKIGEDYWIYVVENALNKNKIRLHIIQNPYKVLQEQSEEQKKIEYTILVKDWKRFVSS